MTSTIAFDNAKPSAGGTEFSITDGVAKAHANISAAGTAGSPYNVSSVTDDDANTDTANLTNAAADTDGTVVFGVTTLGSSRFSGGTIQTTTTIQGDGWGDTGAGSSVEKAFVYFGDLA